MLDSKILRASPEAVASNLRRRGFELDVEQFKALEERRRKHELDVSGLRKERNERSKEIGKVKAAGEDTQPLLDAVQDLGARLKQSEAALNEVQGELNRVRLGMPNLLHDSVPDGSDES